MNILKHCLIGNGVSLRDTPNRGDKIVPRYLVFHYTAGRSAQSSVDFLCKPEAKASAHVVIARDGEITQLVPFNFKAWHAGISHWDGLTGLNDYSIGIEMDNAGPLTQQGNKFISWFGYEYPDEDVVYARHKHGTSEQFWHAYTEIQITKAIEIAALLVSTYNLVDVIGHEDIARGRKMDPGPAFPMNSIRSYVLGRTDDQPETYRVNATSLNIRSGPGIEYEKVAPPIKNGTEVILLETGDRWSRVEVPGDVDIEGWVSNQYLSSEIQNINEHYKYAADTKN